MIIDNAKLSQRWLGIVTNFEIMTSKSKVYFFFDNVSIHFRDRSAVKKQVEYLFINERKKLHQLSYIFCSDSALLQINRQYLKHDYYTDIITFDLSTKGEGVTGEVYISVERVRENAKLQGDSFKSELLRVIFHGALHLCGYNDKSLVEKSRMRRKENEYMSVPRDTVS